MDKPLLRDEVDRLRASPYCRRLATPRPDTNTYKGSHIPSEGFNTIQPDVLPDCHYSEEHRPDYRNWERFH